ncbi:MAG: hypothetical protein ACK4RK_15720 [Gemmataceae bacterium]
MADEYLYCPSCNNKVKVPEAMLGQVVQCPLCFLVFRAPTRGQNHQPQPTSTGATPPAPPVPAAPLPEIPPRSEVANTEREEQNEQIRRALRWPAIGLLLFGLFGIFMIAREANGLLFQPDAYLDQANEQMENMLAAAGLAALHQPLDRQVQYVVFLMTFGLFAAINIIITLAAYNMLQLCRYGLAVFGSCLALLNCNVPICLVGFPFAIWALVLLMNPRVRNAFDS